MRRSSVIQPLIQLWRSRIRQYSSNPAVQHAATTSALTSPTYTIWGANTGVGKTLASAGLAAAITRAQIPLAFMKPVQTGYPTDSDALLVASACGTPEAACCGPHASELNAAGMSEANGMTTFKTMYAWAHPVSPHLAMEKEGRQVSDAAIVRDLQQELQSFSQKWEAARLTGFALVETAGGVASPMPSGRLQCDGLRPLRHPCILVGDPRLGGISATISAYESLLLRGYDVDVILLLDPTYTAASSNPTVSTDPTNRAASSASSNPTNSTSLGGGATPLPCGNGKAIQAHFDASVHPMGKKLKVLSIPGCPPPPSGWAPCRPGEVDPSLNKWLSQTSPEFDGLLGLLKERHAARLKQMASMGSAAYDKIWWPFTQHASLQEGAVQVVDSRCGEHWQVYRQDGADGKSSQPQMSHLYDACSSWWTQSCNADLHTEVSRSVAYAAGRYLHVMFPENVHEPAIDAASSLLSTVGSGWAKRVFFSDDGSTAIEVALKMAFRKFLYDRGGGKAPPENEMLREDSGDVCKLEVVGLQNAYHGDTLGAMDCVAPSVFNSKKLQAPWYTGRGLFLHPPYLALVRGKWQIVDPPQWLQTPEASSSFSAEELRIATSAAQWSSLDEALPVNGRGADGDMLVPIYRSHIEQALDHQEKSQSASIGACIIEPLIQGAGGMLLVDPLFQKVMVQVCRSRSIPVIFDEVMTGLYRIGAISAGTHLLGETPDIAAFAKLMTAGVVPGAATLTTAEVFDSFKGSSKLHALLHGHSYTAFPVGCAATVVAVDMLTDPKTNPNLCHPGSRGSGRQAEESVGSYCCNPTAPCDSACGRLVPLWDSNLASQISMHPLVRRVVHIGTIFATEVGDMEGKIGYGAGATAVRAARLLKSRHNIFARPIGGVVYLMVPPTTNRARCQGMMEAVADVLEALHSGEAGGEANGSAGGAAMDSEGCIV